MTTAMARQSRPTISATPSTLPVDTRHANDTDTVPSPADCAAAGRPRQLHVLTDDGIRLACTDYGGPGAAHTIVFLHGLCLQSTIWAPHIDKLVRRYGPAVRLISYDHRGHGRSAAAPVSSYTIDRLVADLSEVLRALHVSGPLTLVGHSMGGMTALALNRPGNPGGS